MWIKESIDRKLVSDDGLSSRMANNFPITVMVSLSNAQTINIYVFLSQCGHWNSNQSPNYVDDNRRQDNLMLQSPIIWINSQCINFTNCWQLGYLSENMRLKQIDNIFIHHGHHGRGCPGLIACQCCIYVVNVGQVC